MSNEIPLISSDYLCESFEAFLVDLWGTIHDGTAPLEGSLHFLKKVVRMGKPLIFVTNSPQPSDAIEEFLKERIGVLKGEHYHQIITAGEMALDFIKKNSLEGKSCVTWGNGSEDWIVKKGKLKIVDSLKDADFILKHNLDKMRFSSEEAIRREIHPFLEKALSVKIPMVCANPDRKILSKEGQIASIGVGEVSYLYEKMGGQVFWCGKPNSEIYDSFKKVAAKLDFSGENSKIACIGDNLETDIPGGNKANMSTFFFTEGVHKKELENLEKGMSEQMALQKLLSSYDCSRLDGFFRSW